MLQTRKISFSVLKSLFRSTESTPATVLEGPLTSLPKATGAGAFVEPITYQVLGSSSNLLNIKLPKSSILNIRYSNKKQKIVALNGNISSMYTELARIHESSLIFQRCFNQKEPMSLLIALNAQNSNFAVVESLQENWVIKRSSLFAWSGSSMKPRPVSSSHNLIQMDGEGTFILANPGQLMQLDLNEDDSIQVNPRSLIAFTTGNKTTDESLLELDHTSKSVVNLSVGSISRVKKFAWFKKYITIPDNLQHNPSFNQFLNALFLINIKLRRGTKALTSYLLPHNDSENFIRLEGPKTVFLTNAVQMKDKFLTTDELKKLIQHS